MGYFPPEILAQLFLDELNALAEQERRRNPGMSKALAFSKVYTDPANAALAQRERRQNRPRAALCRGRNAPQARRYERP